MSQVLILLFLGGAVILWIYALWDIAFVRFSSAWEKTGYLLFILLFPMVGPIIYLASKRQASKEKRTFDPGFRG